MENILIPSKTNPSSRVISTNLSNSSKDWLTGFWEGDGTLTPHSIGFSQKEKDILEGIVKELHPRSDQFRFRNYGRGWSLVFKKEAYKFLFQILSERVVCPERLEQLQAKYFKGATLPTSNHKPTEDWFVGFWDAEGSSTKMATDQPKLPVISISQKDRRVLDSIKELWKTGSIRRTSWYLTGSHTTKYHILKLLLAKSRHLQKREKLLDQILALDQIVRFEAYERELQER